MESEQRQRLLTFARDTIRARLTHTDDPPLPNVHMAGEDFGGAFCTLRHHGRLRGCMGRFSPSDDLATTIRNIAISAMEDPRFTAMPIRREELPQLDIEISILSKMEKTDAPDSLIPGVHGIYICRGSQAGCFLPQVATEQRWDAATFLSRCCADKARLPADAWRDPDTEVYLFTAEVFGERE